MGTCPHCNRYRLLRADSLCHDAPLSSPPTEAPEEERKPFLLPPPSRLEFNAAKYDDPWDIRNFPPVNQLTQ